MCGIAGLWSTSTEDPAPAVASVLPSLRHRGPDREGVWSGGPGVALGHTRLAIVDLSPEADQPFVSADGRVGLAFNGELYTFQALRDELQAQGVGFRTHSDTEVLLEGYRAWGAGVLDRLVGMFAFAIWDRDRDLLFLARDRAGEKPLYVADGPAGFAFASELEPARRLAGLPPDVDPEAVALYLRFGYVPAPRTIYAGVQKLVPGHALEVTRGHRRSWRYWDPAPLVRAPRLDLSEDEALDRLEATLREAVRGQLMADVPLGAFLSGGIDSSLVVSLMQEELGRPVQTFTIGFSESRYDESPHAAAVAEHLRTDHTCEVLSEKDALALVPRLPTMYGEPFADSSALPTHLVATVARQRVTVALSGDGGDELFGGYTRYWFAEQAAPILAAVDLLPAAVLAPGQRLLGRLPGRAGRAGKLLSRGGPREGYQRLVSCFSENELRQLVGHAPVHPAFALAWHAGARRSTTRRAMLADLLSYLPEDILVKVDRAAMATSLETRAPLLDHRVMELSLRLPDRLVRGKRLLKELAYRRIPRRLLERPKQGFGIPAAAWLRGALRDSLHEAVRPERLARAGVGGEALVARLLDEHQRQVANHSSRLWFLYVLGLWIEHALERSP